MTIGPVTKATRVFMVRHGATVLSAEDRFAGVTEVELSDEGREETRRLAERLSREKISAVYASPLGRTVETARILAEEKPPAGVIHCFSTGRQLADRALELGFYISLSGILTFKNAEALRAIARDVPLERLLVETDAPYLAPVPKRGKRNEPAFIVHTAARLAELKSIPLAALAEATTENFFRLFKKARPPEAVSCA